MRLGVQVDRFVAPGGDAAIGPAFAAVARRAEAAGFASLWVMDHFFQLPHIGPVDDPMPEGYAALVFAAAATERLTLGTLVTGVTYRHPAVLVKTVTTLDVLSGGRAWFGVGAGWFEREHLGLGIPFPPTGERFERLEETLRIAEQMWRGETGPFEGQHYHLAETLCRPLPVSKPRPPILIGGAGEKKTLRLVARYADACNLVAFRDPSVLPHKLDVLRAHCQTEGRPYEEIAKTALDVLHVSREGGDGTESPREAVERLGKYADLGFDEVMVKVPNLHDPAAWDVIAADVVPAVDKLAVAGR